MICPNCKHEVTERAAPLVSIRGKPQKVVGRKRIAVRRSGPFRHAVPIVLVKAVK